MCHQIPLRPVPVRDGIPRRVDLTPVVRVTSTVDWDDSGGVKSSDIAAFLAAWLESVLAGNIAADFNGDMDVNSSDASAFLTAWLAAVQGGC